MHLHKSEILSNLDSMMASLQKLTGHWIKAEVALTDREFDRHGTTYTEFRMKVEEVHSRFSGGRIMLSGPESLLEMHISRVLEYQETAGNQIKWVEQLADQGTRGSAILRSVTVSFSST